MRKLITALVLASTAALAAPAAAQYQNPNPYNYPPSHPRYLGNQQGYGNQNGYGYQQGQTRQIEARIYQLRERIQHVSQRGLVSRNEAYRLQRELAQIERRYQQFAYNGLNRQETYDLEQRIQNLRQQIREDRQDGRGYDDRRYQDDRRYDDRRDDDRRYDDRRYDRDDR